MMAQSEQRHQTYHERLAAARSQQPTTCPACGSRQIQPLFLDDADVWDCSAPGCFATWTVNP